METSSLKLTALGKRGAIVAALAAALAVTLLVGTAWATHWTLQVGDRGWGRVNHDRNFITACDTQADGWGVRTIYETNRGVRGLVGDHDGSDGLCGNEGPDGGGLVVRFRVCAGPDGENERCNPSRTTWLNLR